MNNEVELQADLLKLSEVFIKNELTINIRLLMKTGSKKFIKLCFDLDLSKYNSNFKNKSWNYTLLKT
jgi:hypothetical protein